MQCADELECAEVTSGKYVTTKKGIKYVLTEELGRGGYGCVFKVYPDPADGNEYALKVEKKREHRGQAKLAMEQHIMKLIRDKASKQRSHFIDVVDRGKKTHFFFLVMTLVGESLADLKKARKTGIFSPSTSYLAGLQCLEAIEQLHSVGYIHRDIKPGNYAIGKAASAKTIYILDFGIARNILNAQNLLKGPRAKVAFKGTLRYASLSCHRQQELGKKDDCESWMYMLADMSNIESLPWKGERDREKVGGIKESIRASEGGERIFRGLHVDLMKEMLKYLDSLQYADQVDYLYLYRTIKKAAKAQKVDLNVLFDWEMDSKEGTPTTTHTSTSNAQDSIIQKTQMPSIIPR